MFINFNFLWNSISNLYFFLVENFISIEIFTSRVATCLQPSMGRGVYNPIWGRMCNVIGTHAIYQNKKVVNFFYVTPHKTSIDPF